MLFLSKADPHVYLDKCTYFDQARLDQRFEVVDEPIVSVCSKFAASKFFKRMKRSSCSRVSETFHLCHQRDVLDSNCIVQEIICRTPSSFISANCILAVATVRCIGGVKHVCLIQELGLGLK